MKMTSQAFEEYGEDLVEISKEAPQPKGREVLIEVHHCGVCHSDIHLHDGYFGLGGDRKLDVRAGRELPFTLGHEIEGSIAAVGPDVDAAEGLEIGARRVVFPWIGCDECDTCKAGRGHLCNKPRQLGINVQGGYATHVLVPDAKYVLPYDGIPQDIAGSYMCSGVTAFSALKKLDRRAPEGPVLIVGLGGVGMMGLAFAQALYDSPVYAADIDEGKLNLAESSGAVATFNSSDADAIKAFKKATGGGAAAAVDFAGTTGSFDFAQSCLRKGGKVVVAGLMGGEFSTPLAFLPMRAIAIEGSFVGSFEETKEMLEIVKAGKVKPIPVATRPLCEANGALNDLREGKVVGRVVLTA